MLSEWTDLATDMAQLIHGVYALELVAALVPPEVVEPGLIDSLLGLWESLRESGANPNCLRYFELALLRRVGVEPELDHCVVCQQPDPRPVSFWAARGGITCATCGPQNATVPASSLEAVLAVRDATSYVGAGRLPPLPTWWRDAMLDFLQSHSARPLRVLEFRGKMNSTTLSFGAG